MASDLIICGYVMRPSYKFKRTGLRELPVRGAHGEVGRMAWKLNALCMSLVLLHLFHLAVPES